MPWFGRKEKPAVASPQEAETRAARFVGRLTSFSRQEWEAMLEDVGKSAMANPGLMQRARAEILRMAQQTGMLAVAERATKDLDISGVLPPYPRLGEREQMLSVVTLAVTAVLLHDLIDRSHFDAFFQPYARFIKYPELLSP
jgi:hypothetical protein